MRRLTVSSLLAVAVLAGCGGSGGDDGATRAGGTAPGGATTPPPGTGGAGSPEADRVVRAWSREMDAGDTDGAARSFAPGARVQNGEALTLPDQAAARVFTATLPCGSKVLRTERSAHGYTIAVFELTERPGASCAAGTGNKAAIAFKVSGGRFTEWLRIPVPGETQLPDGPEV